MRNNKTTIRGLAVTGLITLTILIASLFLMGTEVQGQSLNVKDYVPIHKDRSGQVWFIENTPPSILKNGNLVFWSVTVMDEVLTHVSQEVNCRTRESRINGMIFRYIDKGDNLRNVTDNRTSPWFPRTDEISKAYVGLVCYEYPERNRKTKINKSWV